MKAMVAVMVVFGILLLPWMQVVSPMSIREMFHQSFTDRCSKYAFVPAYQNLVQRSPQRYLIFVYHEKNKVSGGFGDRLGGLVSAFAHALRFDRTLLMKASNGFYDLFTQYHNDSAQGSSPRHWTNQKIWSGYDEWKRNHPHFTESNRQEWEYDLSDCVDNGHQTFNKSRISACALDNGDVPHPVIRYASNRAYLCRWDQQPDLPAHTHLRQMLNLTATDDLWEAAGCMLRLVMWPTDLLWSLVDQTYTSLFQDDIKYKLTLLGLLSNNDPLPQPLLQQIPHNYTLEASPAIQFGLQFRCGDRWSYPGLKLHRSEENPYACVVAPGETLDDIKANPRKSQYMRAGTPWEIGSCAYQLLQSMRFHVNASTVPPPQQAYFEDADAPVGHGLVTTEIHSFFDLFTPYHRHVIYPSAVMNGSIVGSTDNDTVDALTDGTDTANSKAATQPTKTTSKSKAKKKSKSKSTSTKAEPSAAISDDNDHPLLSTWTISRHLVYITSDNVYSSRQMREVAMRIPSSSSPSSSPSSSSSSKNGAVALTLTSASTAVQTAYAIGPQGCHIDLDASRACYVFTATQWFLLSLSDVYVTQSFGLYLAPTSAFSRFAGMYGLRGTPSPFRSARQCGGEVFSTQAMSRMQVGNWFCS